MANITPIYTASIPIIKLEINSLAPFADFTDVDTKTTFSIENCFNPLNAPHIDQEMAQIPHLIKIDLTVEHVNDQIFPNLFHLGYQSTTFIGSWLNYYPCLHPIIIIMKSFLSVRHYNSAYTGGISSYCLYIIILAFLIHHNIGGYKDLSFILTNLLEYYGF